MTNSQSSSKNEKSISSSSSRSRKVSNSANPNKTTQKTSCYEFDDEDSLEIDDSKLRSAIREAEGLRPIVKQSPKTPLKKTVKKQSILPNKKSNQESSDDDSSNSSTEKLNNSKSSTHTKSIRATSKNVKLNKRRKTSSSLSFSSSSSSLIPSKKKLSLTNKKNVKKINDTEEEYEDCQTNDEADQSSNADLSKNFLKKNENNLKYNSKEKINSDQSQSQSQNKSENISDTKEIKNQIKAKPNEPHDESKELQNGDSKAEPPKNSFDEYRSKETVKEEEYDEANSSFEDNSTVITMLTNYDDVFVTEITSGVVTVTIKECISKDDFFKKRESDETKLFSPIN